MAVFRLCLFDELGSKGVLLNIALRGHYFKAAEILSLRITIHLGVVPGGVAGKDGAAHIDRIEQALHVHGGEQAQRGKQRLKLLRIYFGVRGIEHIAADGGKSLYHRGAHCGGEKIQLAPAQHRDALEGIEEDAAALLGESPVPRLQECAAKLGDDEPIAAAAQGAGTAQLILGGGAFALDHIPVIKKPLTAGWDGRGTCISAVERVPAAAQPADALMQAQRGLGAGLRAGAFEQPRAGHGVIGEPFIIYIGCEVHTVHDILP